MIYRGSNVDFDEFQKTFYVPRRVDVFEQKQKHTAQWNWLKQRKALHAFLDARPQKQSPRIAPGACSDFGAATG
jgi:hypothetical protein